MYQPRPEPTFSRIRSAPSASSVMAKHLSEQIHEPLDVENSNPESITAPPELRYRPQLGHAETTRYSNIDWTAWAIRSQKAQERMYVGFERVVWGGVGALAGAAAGGIPAIIESMRPGYPFVFSQSFGAAVGAIGGILLMNWFSSHSKREHRRDQ